MKHAWLIINQYKRIWFNWRDKNKCSIWNIKIVLEKLRINLVLKSKLYSNALKLDVIRR